MMSESSDRVVMELLPGDKWSIRIGADRIVRMTAGDARANLSTLLLAGSDPAERVMGGATTYHGARMRLALGSVILSDEYSAMAVVVEDSVGWHDLCGGAITRNAVDERYGVTSFAEDGDAWLKSGDENLAIELQRQGISVAHLVDPVNFFSKVVFEPEGSLRWEEGHSQEGDVVAFRTLMPIVAVFSNTPHPMDPGPEYPTATVQIEVTGAEGAYRPEVVETPNHTNARRLTASRMFAAGEVESL